MSARPPKRAAGVPASASPDLALHWALIWRLTM
eukprot:CAMPEP_0194288618 /NCGR_PEP_ID=MMETSP0169-20130528/37203_1 /TAXON_ID=218684 /ORGANISM="Corethron pennatum, Strain L29A3" /LENGTH=32 /DNA_ID= /DNA_START= /DNA_END= /DNA_ORIENTATION=